MSFSIQISFPQNKVAAYVNQSVVADGLCDQSGALIGWKLINSEDEVIERGLAECDLGAFTIQLGNQWQNYCGETLIVQAALGAQASSNIEIEANCQ